MQRNNNTIKRFDTRRKRKRLYTPQAIYVAKDGHKCNSMREVEIDDFLYIHKIPHDKPLKASFKGQYYSNSYRCPDWIIDNVFIEYFGGEGWLKKYEKNAKWKEEELKRGRREYIILREKDDYVKILYKRFHKIAGKHKKLEDSY
jgi:hypothetical protein